MTLHDCLCSSARRAARVLTARYEAALRPHSLTVPQFELLALLHGQPCNGRSIAHAIGIDAATASRNLQSMLQRKLVCATKDLEDARQRLYSLTPSGRTLLRKALPDWNAVQRSTAELLPPATLATLHALADTPS